LKEGLACLSGQAAWQLTPSNTAIQALVIGSNADALAVMQGLAQRGIWVPAIRPPTVPVGTARLRIALSALHTRSDVDTLVTALLELSKSLFSR
jgi:8-amino-7-oxononanoate synthase